MTFVSNHNFGMRSNRPQVFSSGKSPETSSKFHLKISVETLPEISPRDLTRNFSRIMSCFARDSSRQNFYSLPDFIDFFRLGFRNAFRNSFRNFVRCISSNSYKDYSSKIFAGKFLQGFRQEYLKKFLPESVQCILHRFLQ